MVLGLGLTPLPTLILEETYQIGCTQLELRLSKLHELGLAPPVKEIRVKQEPRGGPLFVCQVFAHCDFPSFANVHTLKLQELDVIFLCKQRIENQLKRFPPTLRSVVMTNPRCTPRHLSHFLPLFPNLDDVEIRNSYTHVPNLNIDDTELVPFSGPKLGGRLVLFNFGWVETWAHLISSCGNPWFRHLDIRMSVSCAPVLLETCAETLETLRLHTSDGANGKYSARWFIR